MAIFGNKKSTASAKKETSKNEEAAVSMKDLYTEGATKVVKSGSTKIKKEVNANDSYRVLIKPLITEKATNQSAHNKYVFVVSLKANKISVAKAIEDTYGIKPVKVNIANASGKKVARGKVRGQRKDWRKAVVTLPQGQTIKIYEGV